MMTTPINSEEVKLKNRIREFYQYLNSRNWQGCFDSIDPMLRTKGIDPVLHAKKMEQFLLKYGPITITSLDVTLYQNVKTRGYGDRDFACGTVLWDDFHNRRHQLNERWVKASDGQWYTRMTSLA